MVTSYKIGEVHFRLLGTKGFHRKAKSERLTGESSKMKISRRRLANSVKKLHQNPCRTCSTIFPHSTNQIIDSCGRRCHCRRHFVNSVLKGLAKLGNIVAETLLRMQMFPSLAARESCVGETNFAARKTKNVFAWSQKHFCFPYTNFASETCFPV